jgi:hypothetical protein
MAGSMSPADFASAVSKACEASPVHAEMIRRFMAPPGHDAIAGRAGSHQESSTMDDNGNIERRLGDGTFGYLDDRFHESCHNVGIHLAASDSYIGVV